MKIIEKWGSGIPRIIRECKEYGLPDPDFIDFDGDFRVNMYRPSPNSGVKKATTQTTFPNHPNFTAEDKAILALVCAHPALTQKELAMELGWSKDRVKYYLKKLKNNRSLKE